MDKRATGAPIHLRLRALRAGLAHTDKRYSQTLMAKALGMDKSTIAKYELSEPGRNCSQRHIPYDYIVAFAAYRSECEGVEITDLALIAEATAAYDRELAERDTDDAEQERLRNVTVVHGRR